MLCLPSVILFYDWLLSLKSIPPECTIQPIPLLPTSGYSLTFVASLSCIIKYSLYRMICVSIQVCYDFSHLENTPQSWPSSPYGYNLISQLLFKAKWLSLISLLNLFPWKWSWQIYRWPHAVKLSEWFEIILLEWWAAVGNRTGLDETSDYSSMRRLHLLCFPPTLQTSCWFSLLFSSLSSTSIHYFFNHTFSCTLVAGF